MRTPIMTLEEAAGFLKMGKRSLYKLIKQKKIPYRKVLNKFRFEKQTLIDWIANAGKSK